MGKNETHIDETNLDLVSGHFNEEISLRSDAAMFEKELTDLFYANIKDLIQGGRI